MEYFETIETGTREESFFYVNEDLPCKTLTAEIDNVAETVLHEINGQSS